MRRPGLVCEPSPAQSVWARAGRLLPVVPSWRPDDSTRLKWWGQEEKKSLTLRALSSSMSGGSSFWDVLLPSRTACVNHDSPSDFYTVLTSLPWYLRLITCLDLIICEVSFVAWPSWGLGSSRTWEEY